MLVGEVERRMGVGNGGHGTDEFGIAGCHANQSR